ncbi:type I restriction-modification system subunit M N-terminal domain-containing protein, partial [Enterobacter bugandensis]
KAPTKKAKAKKGFEDTLWDTANQLRGSVESSEYKHVVLSLVFLKFISDKFESHRKKMLADEEQKMFVDMEVFYQQDNIFYLPEEARWSFIKN